MCSGIKENARIILEEFNLKSSKPINIDNFFNVIESYGAIDDDTFSLLKYEDLEEAGLPRLLARKIANEFRSKHSNDKERSHKSMSVRELLENCDPHDPHDPYTRKLIKLSENKPFIVYKDDNETIIDVNVSNDLYLELKRFKPRSFYNNNGKIVKVYQIGMAPNDIVDEHPLFPGTPLRPDNSSESGLTWGDIDYKTCQILRIAVDLGEITVKSDLEEYKFYMMAKKGEIEQTAFPKVFLKFNELQKLNKLPDLRMKLNSKQSLKSNDPFNKVY